MKKAIFLLILMGLILFALATATCTTVVYLVIKMLGLV